MVHLFGKSKQLRDPDAALTLERTLERYRPWTVSKSLTIGNPATNVYISVDASDSLRTAHML